MNFKVGDKIKIVKNLPWYVTNKISEPKNKYIGATGIIVDIDDNSQNLLIITADDSKYNDDIYNKKRVIAHYFMNIELIPLNQQKRIN